jgi:hypothetical protein
MPNKQKNYVMIIMHTDGNITKIVQKNGFTLEQLQKGVKGYIQQLPRFTSLNVIIDAVPFAYSRGMCYANEEGQLHGLPINRKATAEWYRQFSSVDYYLVGDVVFVARTEEDVSVEENACISDTKASA